jgi:hypothetical protein
MELAHGVAVSLVALNRESGDSIALVREAMIGLQAGIAAMQESITALSLQIVDDAHHLVRRLHTFIDAISNSSSTRQSRQHRRD